MTLELINKLKEHDLYAECIKEGIVSIKYNYYLELHNYYNVRIIVNEGKIMQSLTDTSMAFKCSESTVKRAIKMMK